MHWRKEGKGGRGERRTVEVVGRPLHCSSIGIDTLATEQYYCIHDATTHAHAYTHTPAHPHLQRAGVRSLAATSEIFPSVAEHRQLWDVGFDVVYSYDTPNAVVARTQVDIARGISPP